MPVDDIIKGHTEPFPKDEKAEPLPSMQRAGPPNLPKTAVGTGDRSGLYLTEIVDDSRGNIKSFVVKRGRLHYDGIINVTETYLVQTTNIKYYYSLLINFLDERSNQETEGSLAAVYLRKEDAYLSDFGPDDVYFVRPFEPGYSGLFEFVSLKRESLLANEPSERIEFSYEYFLNPN